MKIIGKFNKDKRYTIVEVGNELVALLNLQDNGSYEKAFECREFEPGLYGIGVGIDINVEILQQAEETER